ncbi:RNA helicase (plasmid) [Cytobacillus spongiae]|uniref:helicase-related protein n=1 Tax=Cytobacillus spongiae TaxID=2901381 RepID=UPI001F30925D|nr:helicase-related protein [Cytobacillus spongiae]UII58450.1 RNA helicase [Cytobacillus spongiae]
MQNLHLLQEEAIEETKQKIEDDITSFLEKRDDCPSFHEYVSERSAFFHQIWTNIWLNKVTNDVLRSHKKAFLRKRGYDIEGTDKKWINKLFRNEIRDYEPFHILNWLNENQPSDRDWEERHKRVRENYLKRNEEKKQAALQKEIRKDILAFINKELEEHELQWYVELRYLFSKKIVHDMTTKTKYGQTEPYMLEEKLEAEGKFTRESFTTVSDFLKEYTGSIHKKSEHWDGPVWEYETFLYPYERFVYYHLEQIVYRSLLNQIPERLSSDYVTVFGQPLSEERLSRLSHHTLLTLKTAFFTKIQNEDVADLFELAEKPFDEKTHVTIYKRDLEEREKKKAAELAELKRKEEEEQRMMEDIFGREYSPSFRGDIKYILHIGETNTGKTHRAISRMKEAATGMYLAPLRLLALEIFDTLNAEGVPCHLKTGEEEKEVAGAKHVSSTVEMFYEKHEYEVIVIDEAQMLADQDRGFSWYRAITKARAKEVHIIGSENVRDLLMELLGEGNVQVHNYKRDIPLQVESKEFQLRHAKKGDALVCFSRKKVLDTASRLQNNGHKVSMIYGSMPPETRKKQMMQFIQGKTNMIVATDAIGMGLNLPIRRIVFLETDKFDGTRRRRLTSQEVKQIAGRAGRKGIYNEGKVAFTKDIKVMKHLLNLQDPSLQTFAIAPTSGVFERFQRYYHDLDMFFYFWEKFESPYGTEKAALLEERELYELIRGTDIEAKLTLNDLYGFLHLPFSKKEPELTEQWLESMYAIVNREELPDPPVKSRNLEEKEVSYKAVGLHLLFLYRMGRQTEAYYWERIRSEIADGVHESLRTEVTSMTQTCKQCQKNLPPGFGFPICDRCHRTRVKRRTRRNPPHS